MSEIKIKRGLDIKPWSKPFASSILKQDTAKIAVCGYDYLGLTPKLMVEVGDTVRSGQGLFVDKKEPQINYTAPSGGRIVAINRGHKRCLEEIIIEVDPSLEPIYFAKYPVTGLDCLTAHEIKQQLFKSGLWTTLRQRPFNKVVKSKSIPQAIFVTAINTRPLAADPTVIIASNREDFLTGLTLLNKLVEGCVFVCKAKGADIAVHEYCEYQEFSGVHPAGLVGTHIHHLSPVDLHRSVWHLDCQDVIAIGKLFTQGIVSSHKIIALAGSQVRQPRLLQVPLGADISALIFNKLVGENNYIISGSILDGRPVIKQNIFLGRYHDQVSVIPKGDTREVMGWFTWWGKNKHSILPLYLARLFNSRPVLAASTNGSPRPIVPIGVYEKVMPLDILATPLLRSLVVGDIEIAEKLGCLELAEEDMALLSYVCPGKYEFGAILRDNLERIEKEF